MLPQNPPRRAKDSLFASVSNIAGSDDIISPVFGSYRFRDEQDVQVKSLGSSGGEESLVEQKKHVNLRRDSSMVVVRGGQRQRRRWLDSTSQHSIQPASWITNSTRMTQ